VATPLEIGSRMLGKNEGPDRAAIHDYLTTGGVNLDPATTAWCAAFVNSTLAQAGIKGTGSNLAKSFLNYGSAVKTPAPGDIAVYPRGDPSGPYGHVGFVQSYDPNTGQVMLLAGNQGNAVSAQPYNASKALGFRHPYDPGVETPTPQAATDAAGPGQQPSPTKALPAPGTPGGAMGPPNPPGWNGPPQPAPTDTAVAARDPTTGLDKKGWRNTLAHLASGYKIPEMARNDTGLAGMAMPGAARIDTPEMPTFDPNQIAQQRQNLALAMQRLNSGRLF
jgi:uncharacterized protein (TIGR02594 family)